jgi:hypothetical protein
MRRDAFAAILLREHELRLDRLDDLIELIAPQLELLDESADHRLESEEYLHLVRRTARVWDEADTDGKRRYTANILVHAGGPRIVSDDVVRMFIDFLGTLNEIHLRVIGEVYNNKGITRLKIWNRIYGMPLPAENSNEADLYRLVIRDLSTGGLIRQHRETTPDGRFLAAQRSRTARPATTGTRTVETSFDDQDGYELTQLGERFVHYVMTDVTKRIGGPSDLN